jgi:hypothetical protein
LVASLAGAVRRPGNFEGAKHHVTGNVSSPFLFMLAAIGYLLVA